MQTLLLDARRGVRAKLCGGLLNRRAQSLLPDSLPAAVLAPLQPQELTLTDADNRLQCHYPPHYVNIERREFDAWLIERAREAGAEVVLGQRVQRMQYGPQQSALSVGARTLRCRQLLDATGAAAWSRRLLHQPPAPMLYALQVEAEAAVETTPQLQVVYRRELAPLFGWAIPKAPGQWLAGCMLREFSGPAEQRLEPLLNSLAERGCVLRPAGRIQAARLTLIHSRHDLWFGGGQLWVIGEAAGLVSPFSGEGISRALLSAELAARAILAGAGAADCAEVLHPATAGLGLACLRAQLAAQPLSRRLSLGLWARFHGWPLKRCPHCAARD